MLALAIAASGLAVLSTRVAGTSWRLSLNVGREPGRCRRVGCIRCRLAFPIDVEFQDEQCHSSASDVGEPEDTILRVLSPGKFVGVNGAVEVAATSGAWSQAATGRIVLPALLHRLSGRCVLNDVELPTGRVFFTNGCWTGQSLSSHRLPSSSCRRSLQSSRRRRCSARAPTRCRRFSSCPRP